MNKRVKRRTIGKKQPEDSHQTTKQMEYLFLLVYAYRNRNELHMSFTIENRNAMLYWLVRSIVCLIDLWRMVIRIIISNSKSLGWKLKVIGTVWGRYNDCMTSWRCQNDALHFYTFQKKTYFVRILILRSIDVFFFTSNYCLNLHLLSYKLSIEFDKTVFI